MLPGEVLERSEEVDLKREYAGNGFFILRNVVSRDRLKALDKALALAFEKATGSDVFFSGGGLISGHLNCFPGMAAQFAYDTLVDRGVLEFLTQLHPGVLGMPNVGCNFNLPGSHAQHYHIDRPFRRDFIIVNVAVVDTDIENGATEVVPGTHQRFYKYSQFVLQQCHRKSVRVPMKAGDVLVRSSNVWHRGMTNHTSVPRPMLAFTWEDGGSPHKDPFAADGGSIRFRPNWFRPTAIGRFRENLFVKIPIIYSTLRFARSLVDSEY